MKSTRLLVASLAISAFVLSVPAQAQTVDLSKTSCKEFLASGKDGIALIWAWLYGYYADQDADPIVDFGKLTSQGQKLAEQCAKSPDKDIISIAEPIYDTSKK